MPDRIEAGTFLICAAITKGNIFLKKAEPKHLGIVIKMIEDDYDKFWNEIDSYPNQVISKSLKNTIRDLKRKI